MNDRFAGPVVAEPVSTRADPTAAVFSADGVTVVCVDEALSDPPVIPTALMESAAVTVPVDVLAEKDVTVMANGSFSTMR